MSEIKIILLLPAEGDPHGLLAEGPCGARPPSASLFLGPPRNRWCPWDAEHADGADGHALVLAYEGYCLTLGIAQLANETGFGTELVGLWCLSLLKGGDFDAFPRVTARVEGLGTLICLDSEGREVMP